MSLKLKTDELPIVKRPPMLYQAVAQSFELRTSQNTGEPYISITLVGPRGKRFDMITLRRNWFDPNFNPTALDPASKEFMSFTISIGARNRLGKVQHYLGLEYTAEFSTPSELAQVLQERCVGQKYWVIEKQRKDEFGNLTENYNLSINREHPKRVPKDAVLIENAPEWDKADDASEQANPATV